MPRLARIFGASHGSGAGRRRPDAFVEPAEHHQIGLLQPRFEQAPDEHARMTAIGRPHALLVEQLAQQRHRVLGRHGQRQRLRAAPAVRRSARRPCARPARATPRRATAGPPTGRGARQKLSSGSAASSSPSSSATSGPHPLPRSRLCRNARRGLAARHPGAGRAARGRARAPRRATARRSSPSPPTKGCLSKASSGTGARSSAAAAAMPSSKCARRRLRQRRAGAVVGGDAPALEQGRHARGKHAVGRDQRGGAARSLDRLAQRQRNRLRFGRGIGQFGGADARQAPLGGLERVPFVAEVGRGHRIGDRPAAHGPRRRAPRRAPQADFAARDAHPFEQQLQMELRMAFLGPAIVVGAKRVPFVVGHHRGEAEARAARPSLRACRRRGAAARRPPAPRW